MTSKSQKPLASSKSPESEQIAIVTGAGSGIGSAIATQLASKKVTVVLFDIDLEAAQQVADTIAVDQGSAYVKKVDISSESSINDAVEWVVQNLGSPSMLCNSAAIQQFGRTDAFEFSDWQRIININLNGTFLTCKALLPYIEMNRGGIVNIASLAGKIGIPYSAAYSASKGGVITMTKALAKEYADRDLRINVIAPGAVDTPMLAMDIPEGINPEVLGVIPRSARTPATPDDIAELVVFLLKDAPYAMTGSVVSIDGAAG